MKLSSAQITSFLQKPDARVSVILIYGPDTGLVRERAEVLAKKTVDDLNDPFRVTLLTGAVIAESPSRLADEMAAQAWGGGRRLVWVQHASENISAAVTNILTDTTDASNLLLIEAGELDKRSKLRSQCENHPQAVALACYVEDGAARQRIVSDILQQKNLTVARDILLFLCDVLPPDRLAMRSELEKLALYAYGQKSVSMEDVLATIHDAGTAELDDLVFAVASGESKRAALLLDRLFAEQTSTVALLRSAQRHFLRLQWARSQMEKGMSAAEAIKNLQPPVFWKYTDVMANQLRRWPGPKIERALARLFETEAAVKRTGTPDNALCSQLFLNMSA